MKMNFNILIRTPLFMSLFVSLRLLAVIAHARTLSESRRRYGLMHVSDDLEMLTSLPPPPSPAALQKMTYSSWGKFMRITQYQRPSAPSPPPPESSDSPDQSTKEVHPLVWRAQRLCSGFKSTVCDYKIKSMIDYEKKSSSPPPPPSSSKSPVTVAKPSTSPPPSPTSSKSPVQISYKSPHLPTITSS